MNIAQNKLTLEHKYIHGAYLVRSEGLDMRNQVLLEFWTNLNNYKHNYHNYHNCGKQVVLPKKQGSHSRGLDHAILGNFVNYEL